MQHGRKRVRSVHNQPYLMLLTKRFHGLSIQCSINAHTMMQRQFLFARLRAIVIETASLFQHLCRPATFRRPAEYQYHASPCLKR